MRRGVRRLHCAHARRAHLAKHRTAFRLREEGRTVQQPPPEWREISDHAAAAAEVPRHKHWSAAPPGRSEARRPADGFGTNQQSGRCAAPGISCGCGCRWRCSGLKTSSARIVRRRLQLRPGGKRRAPTQWDPSRQRRPLSPKELKVLQRLAYASIPREDRASSRSRSRATKRTGQFCPSVARRRLAASIRNEVELLTHMSHSLSATTLANMSSHGARAFATNAAAYTCHHDTAHLVHRVLSSSTTASTLAIMRACASSQ